jgi:SAM-dependent methyltransferase
LTISALPGGTSSWSPPCPHPAWEGIYGGLLSRCTACGLHTTSAQPELVYDETYFTEDGKAGYNFESEFARAHDAARFEPELRGLEARGLKGTVLDIGCASGAFLVHAKARGWDVAGVEVADFARERTSRLLGVPIASALDGLPSGRRFDVVTLHHVLEHIHEPLPFLKAEVAPRVGRLLVVEVPNFSSLASRVHGPRWRDLRPDQHVFHYTPSVLPRLLAEAGFRPVRVTTLWEPLWSLRTALSCLRLLPGLVRRPRHDGPRPGGGLAEVSDPASYRRPKGSKLVLTEASRLALRPLIRSLEVAGLGERLVVEAEPLPGPSRPVRESRPKS